MNTDTDEMLDGYVELVANCLKTWAPIDGTIGIEKELSLGPELFGTADFSYVGKSEQGETVGVIVDLKTGRVDVAAEDNTQLAYYACALRATYPEYVIDKVVCFIHQPRTKGDESWDQVLSYLAKKN